MAEDKPQIFVSARNATYENAYGVVRIKKGRNHSIRGHPVMRGYEHFWTPLVPQFNETNMGKQRRRAMV